MNKEQIFDELVALYSNYYSVHRRTIALDKYNELNEAGYVTSNNLSPDNNVLRESLLEHVGSLPVVAVFLYPYLEHKKDIDLGKVLTMLAIHDIGETIVGDEHPHKKTKESIEAEYQAALQLLPREYHLVFDEYEKRETLEAKFAKSVDVFGTFLVDQNLPPDFVRMRLEINDFSWKIFDEKRYATFEWDTFLKELFAVVISRYQKIDT